MEKLFENTEFESGMGFLIDTLSHCIDNNIHGFISKKNKSFSVAFIFMGLKHNVTVKRKAEAEMCGVPKKISKLNISMENLVLDIADRHGTEEMEPQSVLEATVKNIKKEVKSKTGVSSGRKRNGADTEICIQHQKSQPTREKKK